MKVYMYIGIGALWINKKYFYYFNYVHIIDIHCKFKLCTVASAAKKIVEVYVYMLIFTEFLINI